MECKIWRQLISILIHRIDLADVIKPFLKNLNKKNINDSLYIQFLEFFSHYQLKLLSKIGVISPDKFKSLITKKKVMNIHSIFKKDKKENEVIMDEIISGDKVYDLQSFIMKFDIQKNIIITKSFQEIKMMKIPLIQYCIMKKAIQCFKYLLVNGYDDPNKYMEEKNQYMLDSSYKTWAAYKWDCMATAIYFGNKVMMKILEEKGIEKGKNPEHIEAAVLSYRNEIVEEIIDEKNEEIDNLLKKAMLACSKNGNIKAVKLLIEKGVELNYYYYRNLK